jgi:hypothetical protein
MIVMLLVLIPIVMSIDLCRTCLVRQPIPVRKTPGEL